MRLRRTKSRRSSTKPRAPVRAEVTARTTQSRRKARLGKLRTDLRLIGTFTTALRFTGFMNRKAPSLSSSQESSDGTVLRATKPNEFGGFSELAIELPNHKRVGHRLASWVHRPVRAECGNTPRRLLGRPPSAALRQV